MSRPNYLEQGRADADDRLLRTAITQGVVPPGCLIGGAVVMGMKTAGTDPCSACETDRDVCGGVWEVC